MFLTFKVGKCRVQELLDAKGMSQLELADKTGISKGLINDKIKNRGNKGMRIDTAKKIATALGCCIEDLYEWLPDGDESER